MPAGIATITIDPANNWHGVPTTIQVHVPERNTRVGREGAVYPSTCGQYAVKIFHDVTPVRMEYRRKHITTSGAIFARIPKETLQYCAYPLAAVRQWNGMERAGVVMPFVHGKELYSEIKSELYAHESLSAGRNWSDFLEMAVQTADVIDALHRVGGIHGDIQYRNIMSRTSCVQIVILECESLLVIGLTDAWVRGLIPFIAPEIHLEKGKPNRETDCHSLAVLLLQMLLFRNPLEPRQDYSESDEEDFDIRQSDILGFSKFAVFSEHPTITTNRPPTLGRPFWSDASRNGLQGCLSYTMLPPKVQELARKAFMECLHASDKRFDRPSPSEWRDALDDTRDTLFTCPSCSISVPYPVWKPRPERRCPFCGTAFPVLLVLSLKQLTRRGLYESQKRLVVLPSDSVLYEDHIVAGHSPRHRTPRTPVVAHISYRSGVAHLKNETGLPWQIVNRPGQAIPPKVFTPLKIGDIIEFPDLNAARKRRAAVVEEAPDA